MAMAFSDKKSVSDNSGGGNEQINPRKFTPLAERLEKKTKILVLSELFGGTMAYNQRAMVGVCQLLRKTATYEPMDMVIINGGLMPEVPARGSRGNRRKMEFLSDGIENIPDAVR